MISNYKIKNVKKLQKEATVLKNLSYVFIKNVEKIDIFNKISFNRLSLNKSNSLATIYLYSSFGKEVVELAIREIVKYIPEIRHDLAQILQFRYMPKLFFTYDAHEQKVVNLNNKIDMIIAKDQEKI